MEPLIIEAGRTERNYWRDLWRYRELFQVLAWRDLSVQYKQTVIGVAWALIRPFLTMVIFTVVFGKIAALPTTSGISRLLPLPSQKRTSVKLVKNLHSNTPSK